MITIPWWYARFENMCDVRSSHSGTLHVNVREYLGSSGCCVFAESDAVCGRCRVLGDAFVAESEYDRGPRWTEADEERDSAANRREARFERGRTDLSSRMDSMGNGKRRRLSHKRRLPPDVIRSPSTPDSATQTLIPAQRHYDSNNGLRKLRLWLTQARSKEKIPTPTAATGPARHPSEADRRVVPPKPSSDNLDLRATKAWHVCLDG